MGQNIKHGIIGPIVRNRPNKQYRCQVERSRDLILRLLALVDFSLKFLGHLRRNWIGSRYGCSIIGLSIWFLASCAKEVALPIQADFAVEVVDNDYSVPVRVRISNETEGADTYEWTFEGGNPSISNDRNPGTIQYNTHGAHTIRLKASNRDGVQETKDYVLTTDEAVVPGFNIIPEGDDFAPMTVSFEYTTQGASTYRWTFEGGVPSISEARTPGKIVFLEPGEHLVTLEVGNGRETHSLQDTVKVSADVFADFEIVPAFADDDYQAPVTLTLVNKSVGATGAEWTCATATPSFSTAAEPVLTISAPGLHQIKLKAFNTKRSDTKIQEITIYEDTNLRVFQNIELGISTAHNSGQKGAFFSTLTREVYHSGEVPHEDASAIDIAFFALNPEFNFNKFLSPSDVQEYTFDAIPNATHTKFVNLQESCECQASLSVDEFDGMMDDSLLEPLLIEETIGGIQDFDSTVVPRIVLFETSDGRKGAIKLKEFVQDGTNSRIVMDVKVQKQ